MQLRKSSERFYDFVSMINSQQEFPSAYKHYKQQPLAFIIHGRQLSRLSACDIQWLGQRRSIGNSFELVTFLVVHM